MDLQLYNAGQIAGIIAVLVAFTERFESTEKQELAARLDESFEPLTTVLLADAGLDSDDARDGADAVRQAVMDKLGSG